MKKIFSILLCIGLVAGFVACEKDKEFELTKLEVLNESFLTTDSSAVLSCQLKTNATISEAYVHYSINSDFTDYSVAKMISKDGGHSAELRDLQDTTEYYVRYEATNVYSSVINDAWSSFKTKKRITIPIVSTTSASQVMESTATVGGSINSNGGAEVKECGVVYSMSEEPTIADYKVTCSAVMDSYQLNLTWLQAGVNYYVRAYAINEKGVGYGETVVFTTKSVSVSAPSGTENGYDYVDLGLSVKWATMNVGATKPENFGAYYAWGELEGNKKSYSWGNYKYATMNENNVITLLKYNSSNNYGAVDNKTNLDLEDDVAHSQWGGRWRMPTRDELEELLECEWIWTEYNGVSGCVIRSKTNNNSIFMPATGYIEDETRYNKGTNMGIFSSTLYTTNPLRAYGVAMNFSTKQLDIFFFLRYNGDAIRGVVGEEILQIELPTITTTTATQITTNSAVAGGNVTSDGNASVTERGVCISTVSNPTTANTRITAGSGTGEFTCNLTGLQEGTKYYVRAYAVNSKGTAYGEEVVFTTTVAGVPTITTTQPSQVTETTAVSGGNVTSDGGASVTERGVVYSLSASPSIADLSSTIVRSGSGTGTFTCNLSNLQAGTTYYVRAYAVNSKGTAYGDEISFTTALPISLATVITSSVSNITETTATAGGNVTSDGNASVTERGVCISTVSNPTTANTKITAGSGIGSFTCNLSNLQAGTTYYVRAYAVNSKGTAYGEQVSFTTALPVSLASVTTSSVSNVTETTALAGGNVTSDGNASVTERGVCISTVSNPTTANTKITAGSGTGSFTCNLTGLQANTTYYVRAYAINSKGTAYGEQVSFTTNRAVVLPSVITSTITQITETSAVAGGNVTSDGGASVTERGVVYSTVSNPVINNIYHTTITSGSGTGSFSVNLTNLVEGTTYYVRAYAVNSAGVSYGEEVSFTTNEQSSTPNDGTENSHEYVDLGLSVKWATCNVGANAPEEYGDYFAWGETSTKSTYSWSTYKYCNGSSTTFTKYNTSSSYGTVDNKTQLELSDDAARANWGGSWRMPTEAELDELRTQCTWTWTTQNGANGYKVTSEKNGNSIFLPAAGSRYDSSLNNAGSYGNYCSSSLYTGSPYYACGLSFGSDYVGWSSNYRRNGQSVRPVLGENEDIAAMVPFVTTAAITQITETSAVAGGNVTSDGGASVTERGVVYSTVSNPVINNIYHTTITSGSGTGSFSVNLTNLVEGTPYYVRAYAVNSTGVNYGEEVSFMTKPNDGTSHEYVDLGLSVKWATCNVGANAPEEYGDYFAWGETTTKSTYSWSTYKYCNGSSSTLTKYNNSSSYGSVDNKTQLELSDDAAAMNWGGNWRMPTDAEMAELRNNCTWEWTTQNGVNGYKVTSKSNGNSIFLPAAGERYGSSLDYAGSYGDYWSSSLRTGNPIYAYVLDLYSSGVVGRNGGYRYYGHSVRPVCP